MDFIETFGPYVVRALGLVARWLAEATAPVPWPLVVVVAALPVLMVLRFVVWFLRGSVWPVRCKYPFTTQARHDQACRAPVAGEWRYCRDHRKRGANSRGKLLDPDLPKWQTIVDGERVDRRDVRGADARVTVLFHRGFARRPSQLPAAVRDVWEDRRRSLVAVRARLLRRPTPVAEPAAAAAAGKGPTARERAKYRAVDPRAQQVDQALRTIRVVLPLALLATAWSAFLAGRTQTAVEYVALLLLWVCVEVFRQSLSGTGGKGRWQARTLRSVAKAFVLFVLAAVICASLDGYVLPFMREVLADMNATT